MSVMSQATLTVRQDPRIARSEAAIRGALLAALRADRSFASLTVSEVAAAAGVTRKTFYARFGSLEQVVQSIVDDIFVGIRDRIGDDELRLPRRDVSTARLVFEVYEGHQDVLAPLVMQCPASLFLDPARRVAEELLDRALVVNDAPSMDATHRAYFVSVLASVVHGLLTTWVRREFREPPEAIAALVDVLLGEGIERLLLGGAPTLPS